MELLVATWSVRLAALSAVAMMGVSLYAGVPLAEASLRAVGAAFAFTLGGRLLLGYLEAPERRTARLLAERERRRPTNASRRLAATVAASAPTAATTTATSELDVTREIALARARVAARQELAAGARANSPRRTRAA